MKRVEIGVGWIIDVSDPPMTCSIQTMNTMLKNIRNNERKTVTMEKRTKDMPKDSREQLSTTKYDNYREKSDVLYFTSQCGALRKQTRWGTKKHSHLFEVTRSTRTEDMEDNWIESTKQGWIVREMQSVWTCDEVWQWLENGVQGSRRRCVHMWSEKKTRINMMNVWGRHTDFVQYFRHEERWTRRKKLRYKLRW